MNEKRKRAAPTIDLTATEVPGAPAEHDARNMTPSSHEQGAAQQQSDVSPPPPPEEPPHEPAIPPRRAGGGMVITAIAGGVVGALLTFGVLAALWYAELMPVRTVASNDQTSQIAALQKQLQDLQMRPVTPADSQASEVLRQRLSKLENDIAQLPPGDKTVAERLAAADNAMKSLGIALAVLNKRSDDVAAKASQAQEIAASNEKTLGELRERVQSAKQGVSTVEPGAFDALQKRIVALERSFVIAQEKITETAASEKVTRLALSAAALREAVERGGHYQAELAQAKSLGASDAALAPLEQFAARGLPDKTDLARQLTERMPAIVKAVGDEAASGGFLGRLQANAGKLVRIQPIDAPIGDYPSDVLARIEVDAAHANIDAALSDIGKLPEAARQKAADWVRTAAARQKALAAAQHFASVAASSLNKPAGADAKP